MVYGSWVFSNPVTYDKPTTRRKKTVDQIKLVSGLDAFMVSLKPTA